MMNSDANRRLVVLYIATSLDGYIADPDGGLSFLSTVERPGEDYGYAQFYSGVSTFILGRRTYEKVLSFGIPFPHQGKECYVISRSKIGEENGAKFYAGDLSALLEDIRSREGGNIFIDGGAELVNSLMREALIDQLVISVVPVMLGAGIRLFNDGILEQSLTLDKHHTFESGLVQLWYSVNR